LSKKVLRIQEVDGTNVIIVDNEVFDWGVEKEDIKKARDFCREHPDAKQGVLGNLQTHFTESFSEFLGHKVELKEINKAIKDGYIEI
jgi:hypothetical protein